MLDPIRATWVVLGSLLIDFLISSSEIKTLLSLFLMWLGRLYKWWTSFSQLSHSLSIGISWSHSWTMVFSQRSHLFIVWLLSLQLFSYVYLLPLFSFTLKNKSGSSIKLMLEGLLKTLSYWVLNASAVFLLFLKGPTFRRIFTLWF